MYYPNATLRPGYHHNAHPSATVVIKYNMLMPEKACCIDGIMHILRSSPFVGI